MAMTMWILALIVFPACLCERTVAEHIRVFSSEAFLKNDNFDGKCNGTCQDDSQICRGSYMNGLCPGGVTNRCCTSKFIITDTKDCKNVMIISRDSWGARRPRDVSPLKTPVLDFFIHHTDTPRCGNIDDCIRRVKSIQNFHMDDRKWSDIAYSFLVGEDGNVYEGRGWTRVGAHTHNYNAKSLAASMIGDFSAILPNAAALKSAKELIKCGVDSTKRISPNYSLFGHRDVNNATDCPGTALYSNLRSWYHYHFHKP